MRTTVIPTIVTHPCTLFRDGLRHILDNTAFRPIYLAAELNQAAMPHLTSAESCIFLLGLDRCDERTFDLVRRICAANTGVKVVILVQSKSTNEVWPAIQAGARGFLYQDISGERLVKSLELVSLGETLVPAEFVHAVGNPLNVTKPSECSEIEEAPASQFDASDLANGANGISRANGVNGKFASDEELASLVKGLSRRETSILRLLTQGTSNKLIARQLVITEATVKVHIKAILRKLRLNNRTQAAMWACNHLSNGDDHSSSSSKLMISAAAHTETLALQKANGSV